MPNRDTKKDTVNISFSPERTKLPAEFLWDAKYIGLKKKVLEDSGRIDAIEGQLASVRGWVYEKPKEAILENKRHLQAIACINGIINYIKDLSDIDDIPMQIQYCTPILKKIDEFVGMLSKAHDGYKRKACLIFRNVIKINCGEMIFGSRAISAFIDIAESLKKEDFSKDDFVSQYKLFDSIEVEVFPAWE